MAKQTYLTVGGSSKKDKVNYAVIDTVSRKIKKMYAVVGGITKDIMASGRNGQVDVNAVFRGIHYYLDGATTAWRAYIQKDDSWNTVSTEKNINDRIYRETVSANFKYKIGTSKSALVSSSSGCYVYKFTSETNSSLSKFDILYKHNFYTDIDGVDGFSGSMIQNAVWSANGDRLAVCLGATKYLGVALYNMENDVLTLDKCISLCTASVTGFTMRANADLSLIELYKSGSTSYRYVFFVDSEGAVTQLLYEKKSYYTLPGYFTEDGLYYYDAYYNNTSTTLIVNIYYINEDGSLTLIGTYNISGITIITGTDPVLIYVPKYNILVINTTNISSGEYVTSNTYRFIKLSPTGTTDLGTSAISSEYIDITYNYTHALGYFYTTVSGGGFFEYTLSIDNNGKITSSSGKYIENSLGGSIFGQDIIGMYIGDN